MILHNTVNKTKIFYFVKIAILSILYLNQAYAGLKDGDMTFKKDNITVILTGHSLFYMNSFTHTTSYGVSDEFVSLVTSHEKEKTQSLKMIISTFSDSIIQKQQTLNDREYARLKAINKLSFPEILSSACIALFNGGFKHDFSDSNEFEEDSFYTKKAEETSKFSEKFNDTDNIYIGYSKSLYPSAPLNECSTDYELNDDCAYAYAIKTGHKSYDKVKTELLDILEKNSKIKECHLILPPLKRFYNGEPSENIKSTLYSSLINGLLQGTNLPITVYLELYRVDDINIQQIIDPLNNGNFQNITP